MRQIGFGIFINDSNSQSARVRLHKAGREGSRRYVMPWRAF